MNTERLNSWLTLAANLGVLIGLVVVILELRQATDVAQAQMADAATAGHNELNMAAFSSPQTARVVVLGFSDPSKLTDVEAAQFQFWLRAKINQEMRVWQMRQLGFSSATWDQEGTSRQLAGMLSTPGGKLFLEDNQDFPKALYREIEPYLDPEAHLGLTLGRDVNLID